MITNKQSCTVSAQYQIYHSTTTVDISISANGTYTVMVAGSPGEYTAVKTKAVSFCPSNSPDRGWVEANNGMTILPLKLLKFEATKIDGKCVISWATAEESNIDRFEIEISYDGRNFSTAALVFPKNQPASYYVAISTLKGDAYFRLKTIENDGRITYSKVAFLKMQDSVKLKVYMSQDGSSLVVQSPYANLSSFRIYDAMGRIVFIYSNSLGKGTNIVTIKNIVNGVYIFSTDNNVSMKFIK